MHYHIGNKKYNYPITLPGNPGNAAIPFSGGVDSSFLLPADKYVIGDNVVAFIIDSHALARYELEESNKTAKTA